MWRGRLPATGVKYKSVMLKRRREWSLNLWRSPDRTLPPLVLYSVMAGRLEHEKGKLQKSSDVQAWLARREN